MADKISYHFVYGSHGGRATLPHLIITVRLKRCSSPLEHGKLSLKILGVTEPKLQDYIEELFITNFKLHFPQINHIMEKKLFYKPIQMTSVDLNIK